MIVRRISSFAVALGVALMHNTAPPSAVAQVLAQEKSSPDEEAQVEQSKWASLTLQLPSNISAPDFLRPILYDILKKSPTFRRQCLQISRSHNLRIAIKLVGTIPQTQCPALSRVTRFSEGMVQITIFIVAARSNLVELIGHEFEHAREQAEGLDLKSLVDTAHDTVYQLADGSFETLRARQVGQLVAREFRSFQQLSPKVSAAKNAQTQP